MLDYHVHLWPHAERADPAESRLERLAGYCEAAGAQGVRQIALTEHLFRFRAARAWVGDFWAREENASLRGHLHAYFDHHATADLDDYVEAVLAAKAAGLPVLLGLEVDYYPGQMDVVARRLAGYPFDVLLGSVHWLGTWLFDELEDEVSMGEWGRRGVEGTWSAYTEALCELAETKTVDVLAHPDLVKVAGHRPDAALVAQCHERIAQAAASCGLVAEISSAGWRKPAAEAYPAPELLKRFFAHGVPVTTASDSHGPTDVAARAPDLVELAVGAGYRELQGFASRQRHPVALVAPSQGVVP